MRALLSVIIVLGMIQVAAATQAETLGRACSSAVTQSALAGKQACLVQVVQACGPPGCCNARTCRCEQAPGGATACVSR
jgi:hypothetical protein